MTSNICKLISGYISLLDLCYFFFKVCYFNLKKNTIVILQVNKTPNKIYMDGNYLFSCDKCPVLALNIFVVVAHL